MKNLKTSALVLAALLFGARLFVATPVFAVAPLPSDAISSAIMLDADKDGRLDSVDVTLTSFPDESTLDATDFIVDNCSYSTPPYFVDSAVASADHVMLSILEIAVGDMDTATTCDVTVNGLSSTLGNPITGTVTATDGAAPVIRELEYMDANGNGIIDRLIARFSESLAPTSVFHLSNFALDTVGDFTGTTIPTFLPESEMDQLNEGNGYLNNTMGWVSVPLVEGTAVDTFDDSGTFVLSTTSSFVAYDVFSNSNTEVGPQAQARVEDLASPLMKSLSYGDDDGDGKIDTLDLIFTEGLADTSTLTENQLLIADNGGFTGIAIGTGTSDLLNHEFPSLATFVRLPLTEASVISTGAYGAFGITYNPDDFGFLLVDASNNQSGAAAQPFASLPVADGAPVVIVSTSPASGATGVAVDANITIVFSEFMNESSGNFITLNPSVTANAAFNQDVLTYVIDPVGNLAQGTLYTVSFGNGIDSVNNDSAPNAFAPVTFTTQAPPSSGGGGGGGGYIPPRVIAPVEPPAPTQTPAPAPQVLGETDTVAGSYIRGETFSTVYYIDTDLTRRPFIDEQTYFTYQDSWDIVRTVPDADLANYPMGKPMLPKPGIVLVKIQSAVEVYALETNAAKETVLRKIPNEMTAKYVFGNSWADYVIDISPAFFKKFVMGKDLDTAYNVNMDVMKTRVFLNSK